jgi:ATP-binding cassette subfamily C protein LapB
MTSSQHVDTRKSVTTAPDPLLESVRQLLRLQGHGIDIERLMHGMPLTEGQLAPQDLEQALSRQGIASRLSQAPLSDIPASLMPCVLLMEDGSSRVLLAQDSAHQWPEELGKTGTPCNRYSTILKARILAWHGRNVANRNSIPIGV